jgi:hypothetical protein
VSRDARGSAASRRGAGLRGPYERQRKRWQEDREKPYRLMLFLDRPRPYDSGATGKLNVEALGWSHGRQTKWAISNVGRSRTASRS